MVLLSVTRSEAAYARPSVLRSRRPGPGREAWLRQGESLRLSRIDEHPGVMVQLFGRGFTHARADQPGLSMRYSTSVKLIAPTKNQTAPINHSAMGTTR